jgi:mono/diheme cytochrome c family protein
MLPLVGLLLALLGPAPDPPPQATGAAHPPLVISSMSGRDLYQFYCATCHGKDGKGSGPVVPALRQRPPDLTTMASRNGGTFPRERALSFITGDPRELPAAHGSSEMPVWGPIFKALDPNDKANRIRIENVVDYLASIQQK